jgi:import inner membrane translocase subunit TIM54
MPNFRFRLPSRNWSIFLAVVGTWYGAYWYDRREKDRILKKWCHRVADLGRQPLPANIMPRSVTIILSAPPADGLLEAREHFHEYVKPILVAGGMDWDAIEGRKEGDVRAMVAERIRSRRLGAGEAGDVQEKDEADVKKETMLKARNEMGIVSENMALPGGDIVIGRNTWKEYVRGVHEGWLGPLTKPKALEPELQPESEKEKEKEPLMDEKPDEETTDTPAAADALLPKQSPLADLSDTLTNTDSSAAPTPDTKTSESEAQTPEDKKKEEEENKKKKEKKKLPQPPPYNQTSDYANAPLPPSLPGKLGPTVTIPLPHVLGFLTTPKRLYWFLTQRRLAEEIGSQVAAAVLASHAPYQQVEESSSSAGTGESRMEWEVERALRHEESTWHKSTRQRAEKLKEEGKESVWTDAMVVDSRIAGRMEKFVLPEDKDSSSYDE